MTTTLVRSSGRQPVTAPTTRIKKSVRGFVVKGTARPQQGESLLSATESGGLLTIVYSSSRWMPVRKNAKRMRHQRVLRIVICTKRFQSDGDYFWLAQSTTISKAS